jgi:hypothetical protein
MKSEITLQGFLIRSDCGIAADTAATTAGIANSERGIKEKPETGNDRASF